LKYLLVADTHVGINKSSEKYHEVVQNLFTEILGVCEERNIGTVIHLGDFFHERKATNTKTLNIAHRIADIFEQSSVQMYIIVGNHDIYFKDSLTPTALEIFQDKNHIKIVDKITELNELILCPWGSIPAGYDGGWCFGHFEINGFKMNGNYICTGGEDANTFKDFRHVYSGHFHTPSSHGNITYLGSAFPQTFHDLGNKHGYYIWDMGELEFIEFTGAPKFVEFRTGDDIATSSIKGNIVKLIFTEDYGTVKNQQIIDGVWSYEPFKVKPDFSMAKIEGTEETQEASTVGLLDHNEIMREYVRKSVFPDNLKKKTILSMMDKLLRDE
jgi:DNA repair exonuclease SbcCD nuclease subunit